MIYIMIPILSSEIDVFFLERMKNLLARIKKRTDDFSFIFCIQYKAIEKKCESNIKKIFTENLVILNSETIGVSVARNKCLNYALSLAADNDCLYFLDSQIWVSSHFLEYMLVFAASKDDAMLGCFQFVDLTFLDFNNEPFKLNKKTTIQHESIRNFKKNTLSDDVNFIKNCTMSRWLFKANLLKNSSFNETLGPGDKTTIKSAEDVYFLYELSKNKKFNVVNVPYYVYRESRPKDLSKHTLYAKGYGAVLAFLFKNEPRKYALTMFLYLVNTLRFFFINYKLASVRLSSLFIDLNEHVTDTSK
ncbi:hypothetical protein GCM10023116_20550 [Kistimonas scapharcae]|uniref:Glycosyltransferase 2-like domain-containing protein n=1 Tax=Kistimonas scapharcae TaxID=1036133 RepID=A0ABP8V2H2_9GAMM